MKFFLRKICTVFVFLIIFEINIFAQISADPNHNFYKSAQKWELNNYVKNLPPVRPYPVNVIKEILQQAIENGDDKTVEIAKEYWKEITGKPWNIELLVDGNIAYDSDLKKGMCGTLDVNGDAAFFNDLISFGYKVGFDGYTKEALDYLEAFQYSYAPLLKDTLRDPASISKFQFYFDVNDVFSVGTKNCFGQLGVSRLGYGQFFEEGLCLNESGFHSSNVGFTYLRNRFNYSQFYSVIGASKNYDGSGLAPDKYLSFHQLGFKIFDNLTINYYENIIYGNRFDFSYVLPAPYMTLQSIGGFDDNLQMGIQINFKPIKGILWATDIFVDDLNFNEIVKFNFDTKIRIAATTGLIYSPVNSIIDNIKLNYTLITPYTYTHWQFEDTNSTVSANTYNYQTYTNSCIKIGSQMDPNSDKIGLKLSLKPVNNLDIGLIFNFVRHGNIAETLPASEAVNYLLAGEKVYATDGSINENVMINNYLTGNKSDYLDSAWNKLNFLNQKHKMYVFHGGIDVAYKLPEFKWGNVKIKVSYVGEYIKNKGVDSHIFPGGVLTYNENDTFCTYNGQNYNLDDMNEVQTLVDLFKNQWVENLYNQFSNYIDLGIEYRF